MLSLDMAEGIDVAEHYDLICRMFRARFSRRVMAAGCDPEDALQAIFRGILARNAGTNPWHLYEGGRSAPSYIFLVMNSVVMNYVAKHRRYHDRHRVGLYGWTADDRRRVLDVASVEIEDTASIASSRVDAVETMAAIHRVAGGNDETAAPAAQRLLREMSRAGLSVSDDSAW